MEITFVNCMWAYLHDMPLRFENDKLYRGMPGTKSMYGYSEFDPVLGEDYYVGLSEKLGDGPPTGSGDLNYGAFYPTRVFVWGMDQSNKPVDRVLLLTYLKTLGLRAAPGFWNPCRPWWGFETGYRPRFRHALRADANIGLRQHDIMTRMQQPLPEGWEIIENYPNKYSIYIDEEKH